MTRLPLRDRRGEHVGDALVDDEDACLSAYAWHRHAQGYAHAQINGRAAHMPFANEARR